MKLGSFGLVLAALWLLAPRGRADDGYDWYDSKPRYGSHGGSGRVSSPSDGRRHAASEGAEWGLRLGYALPFGELSENAELSEVLAGVVKPQLDLSWGLGPSFRLGGYVAVGAGLKAGIWKQSCDQSGVSCRLLLPEFGLHGEYRMLPGHLVDPWVGASFGMELLRFKAEAAGVELKTSALGIVWGASAGVDFELGRWGVGPVLSGQMGRYLNASIDSNVADGSVELDRVYHYWLTLGARVRFGS